MPIPSTYLLTAPDAADALGQTLTSTELVKGLRMCNPNLMVPDPSVFTWYPGQANGHTSLWLGEPFKGKKITVFRLGAIPEWTQVDPKGIIIARGWRSVLVKVIRSGVASKRDVERIFKIDMSVAGEDNHCPQCRREGLGFVKPNGKWGMCDTHSSAWSQIAKAKRQKKEAPLAIRDLVSHEARSPVSFNMRSAK